jgi:hypothetical protein
MKLICDQSSDRVPEIEGFPMKLWSIEIFLLDQAGNPMEANLFSKVVYNLHPSFANPIQSKDSESSTSISIANASAPRSIREATIPLPKRRMGRV